MLKTKKKMPMILFQRWQRRIIKNLIISILNVNYFKLFSTIFNHFQLFQLFSTIFNYCQLFSTIFKYFHYFEILLLTPQNTGDTKFTFLSLFVYCLFETISAKNKLFLKLNKNMKEIIFFVILILYCFFDCMQ